MELDNYSLPRRIGKENRVLVYFPKDLTQILLEMSLPMEYQWETLARFCLEGARASASGDAQNAA